VKKCLKSKDTQRNQKKVKKVMASKRTMSEKRQVQTDNPGEKRGKRHEKRKAEMGKKPRTPRFLEKGRHEALDNFIAPLDGRSKKQWCSSREGRNHKKTMHQLKKRSAKKTRFSCLRDNNN